MAARILGTLGPFTLREKTEGGALIVTSVAEDDDAGDVRQADTKDVARVAASLQAASTSLADLAVYERTDGDRKIIAGPFVVIRDAEKDVFHWFESSARLVGSTDQEADATEADVLVIQHYLDQLAAAVNGVTGSDLVFYVASAGREVEAPGTDHNDNN
jgi:hypothetical protein